MIAIQKGTTGEVVDILHAPATYMGGTTYAVYNIRYTYNNVLIKGGKMATHPVSREGRIGGQVVCDERAGSIAKVIVSKTRYGCIHHKHGGKSVVYDAVKGLQTLKSS